MAGKIIGKTTSLADNIVFFVNLHLILQNMQKKSFMHHYLTLIIFTSQHAPINLTAYPHICRFV